MTCPRVIVFDLDDTLILERDYAFSGYAAVAPLLAKHCAPQRFIEACQRQWETGNRSQIFNAVLRELTIPADAHTIERLIRAYRRHRPTIDLLPDAVNCIAQLRSQSHPPTLCIITDGPHETQLSKLRALNISDVFDHIIPTDQWGKEFWKPHPRAFQLIQTEFTAGPSECVYVGDNPTKDFHAPTVLGWCCIRISRPDGIWAETPTQSNHAVRATLTSLDTLPSLLGYSPVA